MNELFKDMVKQSRIEFQKAIPHKLDYVGKILIIDANNFKQNKN